MSVAYYNEFDPKAAAWLRRLIINGDITPGVVDERSIIEVKPDDLINFDRVHFFAGVGTWDYCLNQSGWKGKIWTASLPCQPFSAAGKGLGKSDERHLLPHFLELVRECRPDRILGEQVERAIAHGWLDDLQATMEAEGYAVGHCVLGAHSIGAPHIRQRLYWVANAVNHSGKRSVGRINGEAQGSETCNGKNITIAGKSFGASEYVCGLGIADSAGLQSGIIAAENARYGDPVESASDFERVSDTESQRRGIFYTENTGPADAQINTSSNSVNSFNQQSSELQFADVEWIYCRDNKYRPVKPGIQPLVDGITRTMGYSGDPGAPIDANKTQEARTMRLKGYGNAIQAQTAIAFIKAYMSCQ